MSNRLLLRAGLAFIWLATGLGVFHESYRAVGEEYLARLGLPGWLMFPACAAEVVLGLAVLFGPSRRWLSVLQVALVAFYTVVLAWAEPKLLVDPFGVLSKNVAIIAVVIALDLIEREGPTARAGWVLRAGVAFVWVWEGLFACVLFQSETLRAVLEKTGLPLGDPALLLTVAGVGEVLAGLGVLLLRGRPLRLLLAVLALGVVVICVLVTLYDPALWFHPFGPITKNVPLLAATVTLCKT